MWVFNFVFSFKEGFLVWFLVVLFDVELFILDLIIYEYKKDKNNQLLVVDIGVDKMK